MFTLDGQSILALILQLGGAGGFAWVSTEILKRLQNVTWLQEGQTARLRLVAWIAGSIYTVTMGLASHSLDVSQFSDILKTGVETLGALLIAHGIHKGVKAVG